MNAYDWHYTGEGGKHALFSFVPQSSELSCSKWNGYLLRLDKDYLACSEKYPFSDLHMTGSHHSRSSSSTIDPLFFIREVACRKLGSYVDIPILVYLPWSCVQILRQQALDKVPDHRKPDWQIRKQNDAPMPFHEDPVPALLVPDYRLMKGDDAPWTLWMELKPKAGYCAFSPLVLPEHRAKYRFSRYRLQRHTLEELQMLQHTDHSPGFDPLDLYSGDYRCIHRAMAHLFQCPRNNFRIGSQSTNSSSTFDDPRIRLGTEGNPIVQENMSKLMATILHHEPALRRILSLQELDVIDADGAVLLYDSLVDRLKGDSVAAEALLDDLTNHPLVTATSNSDDDDISFSVGNSSGSEALRDFFAEAKHCKAALNELKDNCLSSSSQRLDEIRQKAMDCIPSFTVDDIVLLLQNWLISLTFCDISLILTVSGLDRDMVGIPWSSISVTQVQTCQGRGQIEIGTSGAAHINNQDKDLDHSNQVCIALYQLKMIDCGQKPSNKLRTRREKETKMFKRFYKGSS
jgi:hypothetical protein